MSIIGNVFNICGQFTANPTNVFSVDEKIKETSLLIKKDLPDFKEHFMGMPFINENFTNRIVKVQYAVFYELIAGSINYKYWYGRYNIRLNNSSSIKMYKDLDDVFKEVVNFGEISDAYASTVIDCFIKKISVERYPMLNERINHLRELNTEFARDLGKSIYNQDYNLDYWLERLITSFPGYAQDIFLKRAFLFFMMLNRRMGWFKEDIHKLPIPADYQIPKMLKWLGCIKYSSKLSCDIMEGKLIPKGSLEECELRATSIMVCKRLSELADCSMADVDNYLWKNRKQCKEPFHLTITTDY